MFGSTKLGVGFTVNEKVCGEPGQLAPEPTKSGVTSTVATTGELPLFKAVNARIFPAPLAAKPIEGKLFVQE